MKTTLLTALAALSVLPLRAQEAVFPAEGRHMGRAGEVKTGEFRITNVLTEEVKVSVDVSNEGLTAGSQKPLPPGNWITLSPAKPFTLAPGKTRALRYTITIPTPFTEESVATLTLNARPTANPDAPGAIKRSMPIYLVPVAENVTLGMTVALPSIRLAPRSAGFEAPMALEASIQVTNSGTAQILPKGLVEFKSGPGVMETLILVGPPNPLLPGMAAPYSGFTQKTDWPGGTYQAVVRFTYGEAYGPVQTFEKTYTFNISGNMLSVQP